MTAPKAGFAASRSTDVESVRGEIHDVPIRGKQASEQPTQARVVLYDEQVHRADRDARS